MGVSTWRDTVQMTTIHHNLPSNAKNSNKNAAAGVSESSLIRKSKGLLTIANNLVFLLAAREDARRYRTGIQSRKGGFTHPGSLNRRSESSTLHSNLALLLSGQGYHHEALKHIEHAVGSWSLHLGQTTRTGRTRGGDQATAVRLDPHNSLHIRNKVGLWGKLMML